jgi:hypothetical protein
MLGAEANAAQLQAHMLRYKIEGKLERWTPYHCGEKTSTPAYLLYFNFISGKNQSKQEIRRAGRGKDGHGGCDDIWR